MVCLLSLAHSFLFLAEGTLSFSPLSDERVAWTSYHPILWCITLQDSYRTMARTFCSDAGSLARLRILDALCRASWLLGLGVPHCLCVKNFSFTQLRSIPGHTKKPNVNAARSWPCSRMINQGDELRVPVATGPGALTMISTHERCRATLAAAARTGVREYGCSGCAAHWYLGLEETRPRPAGSCLAGLAGLASPPIVLDGWGFTVVGKRAASSGLALSSGLYYLVKGILEDTLWLVAGLRGRRRTVH